MTPVADKSMTSSVALCTYDGGRSIEEQVRSILDRTVLPAEIVVFDDRSSDRTVAFLQRLTLPQNSVRSGRVVLRETVSGRYRRYSSDLKSAGKVLLPS